MTVEFEFFITNTPGGWKEWDLHNVSEPDTSGVTIAKDPVSTYLLRGSLCSPGKGLPPGAEISDIALDGCGSLYVALAFQGPSAGIFRHDTEGGTLVSICFQAPGKEGTCGDMKFKGPLCIGFAGETAYVLDGGAGALHAISRYTRQLRWTLNDDRFDGSAGLRMALDRAGTVYISNSALACIMRVPAGGEEAGAIVSGLDGPRDITVYDGALYVLDCSGTKSSVKKYGIGKSGYVREIFVPDGGFHVASPADRFDPSCIAVGSGGLLAGESFSGGNDEEKKSLLRYLPAKMAFGRIFACGGSASRLVPDRSGGLYLVPGDKKSLYFLEYCTKNNPADDSTYSAFLFRRFDSGKEGTRWHRLTVDFEPAGPGTMVRAGYYATDDANESVHDVSWRDFSLPDPRDALFEKERATGRFLWVKLSMLGTEFASPLIRSARVYFPFMSYLRYLPAIYGEDRSGKEFLERFLPLLESFFADMGESIESVPRYFDPYGVPGKYLSWLGSWLAIASDETWSEPKVRELIARAPELYKKRGTKEGIRDLLRLYLGGRTAPMEKWEKASIMEKEEVESLVSEGYLTPDEAEKELEEYDKMAEDMIERPRDFLRVLEYLMLDGMEDGELKDDYRRLLGCPNCYTAIAGPGLSDEERRAARRILERESPAHTTGRFVSLAPWIILGGHTYLGINAALSDPRFVLELSRLGRNAELREMEKQGQLELKSRLGIDSSLS